MEHYPPLANLFENDYSDADKSFDFMTDDNLLSSHFESPFFAGQFQPDKIDEELFNIPSVFFPKNAEKKP